MALYMKTNIHFRSHLAEFFVELKMFQTTVVEKLETHILCSITFFPENRALYDKMWKNIVERGTPQMAIWRMDITYWRPKATNTHTGCVNSLLFHFNNGCTKSPQRYVTRTQPVFLRTGIVLYLNMANMYRNMLAKLI
jgi:hypothetical protein